MYYITLDLEWNQAYAQKALAIQRRLSLRLRGEVIQIGAVKLDKNMNICGSYQIIVKPKYYKKLHRHVSELTGITQEQMDMGTPLPEAIERFRKFCGRDFVFLTWGPDDIPMLKENFNANGMEHSWLDRTYDLQKIFNSQTDGLNKQRSLEYAMDYYEIPMTLPAHDALNDAYFTAQVAQKMDVAQGIREYEEQRGENLLEDVIGDADAGGDGYVTIGEMLDDEIVKNPTCPVCGKALKSLGKPLHSKGQKYTFYFECKKDGELFEVLRLHRNFNDTWRARRTFKPADEQGIKDYLLGIEKSNIRHKARRRKPSSKRRTQKPEQRSE